MKRLELYTLDNNLNRVQVVEGFETLIWTERYSSNGDFEIDIKSTAPTRALLVEDTWMALNQSKYVMQIETITDSTDDSGTKMLKVVGRDMVKILNDRVAMPAITDTTTTPNWVITGNPGNIARTMFDTICAETALNPNDGIDFYVVGKLLPHGSIPESTDIVTVTFAPDTLYNSVKNICDAYNLGFRLVKHPTLSQVYFEVYTGEDRTSSQAVNPAVIFSPDLDNLVDTTTLTSTAGIKNVAYVYAQNGSAEVYAPTSSSSVKGFNRRVLFVDASDIALDAGPDLTTALQQRGLQQLAGFQTVYQFDGQISEYCPYVYGTDYNLGDLVEERDADDIGNVMRVTEQIFVSDNQGDRSYPTLSVATTITPGTWSAWDANQTWSQVDPSIVWADLQ